VKAAAERDQKAHIDDKMRKDKMKKRDNDIKKVLDQ